MSTAPNIENYYIGKGVVSFKRDGETDYRDLGNVPTFEFTPVIEKLDHFSSRSGVKSKDRTVVISKSGTVRLVMDEWDVNNLAMALLGDISVNSDGNTEIAIFASNAISGSLKFRSANEVGPKFEWVLNKVDFIPSANVSPISEEFGQLEVNGEVSAVNGLFGTVVELAGEDTDITDGE